MAKSLSDLLLYPDLPSLLRVMRDHYFNYLSRDENQQLKSHSQPMIIFTTRAGMAACLEFFFRSLVDDQDEYTEHDKAILRSRIRCLRSRTQHRVWNREFCENPNEIDDKVIT